jgi:hypothetical protein
MKNEMRPWDIENSMLEPGLALLVFQDTSAHIDKIGSRSQNSINLYLFINLLLFVTADLLDSGFKLVLAIEASEHQMTLSPRHSRTKLSSGSRYRTFISKLGCFVFPHFLVDVVIIK